MTKNKIVITHKSIIFAMKKSYNMYNIYTFLLLRDSHQLFFKTRLAFSFACQKKERFRNMSFLNQMMNEIFV